MKKYLKLATTLCLMIGMVSTLAEAGADTTKEVFNWNADGIRHSETSITYGSFDDLTKKVQAAFPSLTPGFKLMSSTSGPYGRRCYQIVTAKNINEIPSESHLDIIPAGAPDPTCHREKPEGLW